MIENKHLTFVQKNTIEKRWALLRKADLHMPVNENYRKISILKDTSRAITTCDEIRLILSEPCLSSGILTDVCWACKYGNIKIRVVAKNEQIISRYECLVFTEVIIDPAVCINYIGIHGPIPLSIAIGNDYTETSDAIERYYFDSVDNAGILSSVTDKVKRIIIMDEKGSFDCIELFSVCRKRNIVVDYIVSTQYFTKETFEKFSPHVALYVSEKVTNGILFAEGTGRICLCDFKTGCSFAEAENVYSYFSELYLCSGDETNKDSEEVPGELYACENGRIIHLDIAQEKVIKTDVHIETMDDFVSERFDRSAEAAHNDYCFEAFQVRYDYTLIPPLYGSDYSVSSAYNGTKTMFRDWSAFHGRTTSFVDDFIGELNEIKQGDELYDVCVLVAKTYDKLHRMIDNDEYRGFHKTVWNCIASIDELIPHYTEAWVNVFRTVNGQSAGSKFSLLDDEIMGYKKTIAERQKLIDQGTDVSNNTKRIDSLMKKIKDLEQLKAGFVKSSSSRDAKAEEEFVKFCESTLSGAQYKNSNTDSLGDVIKPTELTKTKRLERLAKEWLLPMKNYFIEVRNILGKLSEQGFPETYRMYERAGKQYIVIDDLSEYVATKALRNKYKIQCLARREK